MSRSLMTRTLSLVLLSVVATFGFISQSAASGPALEQAVLVLELYVGDDALDKTPAYAAAMNELLARSPYVAMLTRADGETLLAGHAMMSAQATKEQLASRVAALGKAEEALLQSSSEAIPLLKKSLRKLNRLWRSVAFDSKLHALFLQNNMLLARAYLDADESGRLRGHLESTMRAFGTQVLNESEAHPQIVQVWKKLKKNLASERTAQLVVTSKPAGAEVFINGRRQAQPTPLKLTGLFPGEVLVQVRKGQMLSVPRRATLKKEGATALSVDLERERALRVNAKQFGLTFGSRAEFQARGAETAAWLGALLDIDKVLLVELRKEADRVVLAGTMVDVATRRVDVRHEVAARSNLVVRSNVQALGWGLLEPSLQGRQPWYRNTWAWISLGAGVTGLIVGAVYRSDYEARLSDIFSDACETSHLSTSQCSVGGSHVGSVPELEAAAESTQFIEGVSNVSFAVAGLALIGSVLLFTIGDSASTPSEAAVFPTLQAVGPTRLLGGQWGMGAVVSF